MRNHLTASASALRLFDIFPQVISAAFGGVLIFFTMLFGAGIGFNLKYSGRIYPGISAGGIDLSGRTPLEAASILEERLDFPSRGKLLFEDGENFWVASPGQLGLHLDTQETARAAYQLGREGNVVDRLLSQFSAWYSGVTIPPRYILDERTAQSFLVGLAAQIDVAKIEPSLSLNGTEVVVRPGQAGRHLDLAATLEALKIHLRNLRDAEIPLPVSEDPPVILNTEEQAEVARQILSQPLTLVVPDAAEGDPGPWTFQPDALAQMITIQQVSSPEGPRYQVGLQAEGLKSFLEGIVPQLLRYRQNARFIFNDDTRQLEVIQNAVPGRSLNIYKSIQAINEKLLTGEHNIPLEFEYTTPDVGDDATAEELGIRELINAQTSFFYDSSAARIQNITTAASRFHGLLVPPWTTFSMGEVLGDVSLDNGYSEALIIFGNRTIQGVGGGVCQVSTTLFRTAFFGGYPIVERHPHAYRVAYYELKADGGYNTSLAGLDATVFVPLVDFKFTNDTPYWLLMETYVNQAARTLTWKFYSTSDGRQIEWHTSGLQNIVEPPEPLYEENPELAKGEIKQVDWAVEGADVTITRIVRRGGEVLYSDTFSTHYLPWRAVYQYGPGTKGMPPDKDKKRKDKEN